MTALVEPHALSPVRDEDISADGDFAVNGKTSLRAFMAIGAAFIGVLLLGTVVQISGAVIAPGNLSAASQTKSISHPVGGTLARILVKEGQHVKRGDVLLEFDTNVTAAAAEQSGENRVALAARKDRLEAELAGTGRAEFSTAAAAPGDPAAQEAIARERKLFAARQASTGAQNAMLAARRSQLEAEIAGLRSRVAALRTQKALLAPELSGLRQLYKEGLVTINRLNEIERSDVSLRGEIGTLEAGIRQSQARISEINREIGYNSHNIRSMAGQELNQVVSELGESELRAVNANDVLDRSSVRAPQDGLVDSIAFITPGSAVPPGQPILRIVPSNDSLIAEVRVSPNDIDQVKIGQPVRLKFSSVQTSPEADGRVQFVSPDRTEDPRTGQPYYLVRIAALDGALSQAAFRNIGVGLPVEAYIQTEALSFMHYIFKPLLDQIGKAFRQ